MRKGQYSLTELYKKEGQFAGYNNAALSALLVGAIPALFFPDLGWLIGFFLGGISYILLSKYAFKGSRFKQGTIFEEN